MRLPISEYLTCRTVSDVELPYRGVLVKLSLLTGGTSLAIP